MRIKILGFVILSFFSLQSVAQMINSTVADPRTEEKMLVGYCDIDGLNKNDFGAYFRSQYDLYQPSEVYINKLKDKLDDIEITVVFGTWCSDSKRQVPRFFKVLNNADYNQKRVKLIAVDKTKAAIIVDIKDLNIERIPTFIIYKNDVEIGRIVETPKSSLEKDLWKIVR